MDLIRVESEKEKLNFDGDGFKILRFRGSWWVYGLRLIKF